MGGLKRLEMKLAKSVIENEWIRHQVNHYGEGLRGLGDVMCDVPKCQTKLDRLQFVYTADKDGKLTSLTFLCRKHFDDYIKEHSLSRYRQYLIKSGIEFEEFEYTPEELRELNG